MSKLNMSTADYAEAIADSFINGQHKQAVKQFRAARRANCDTKALLQDFAAAMEDQNMGDDSDVITLCANIINGIDRD